MSAPEPALPGALAGLAPLLDEYGYPAVALFVLLDNCGIPAPGQTILVLASVYAGAGHLSFAAVVAIAFAAAVVGNSLGYLIGSTGGRAFVHRWGRYVMLTPARMERADGFFARHGGKVVTVARFVDVLRQTNGIIAGTTEMGWRRFQPFNVLGAALWVGVWSAFGYLAGSNIGTVYRTAVRYQLWLLIAVSVLCAALGVRQLLRRRQRGRSSREDTPGGGEAGEREAGGGGAAGGNEDAGGAGTGDAGTGNDGV